MSENILHRAIKLHIEKCFCGNANPGFKFWHVGNETRDATQAFWNKQMGILPGVSDFQCGWPVSKAGVLEVKFGKNKLTAPQNKFISWAHSIGWEIGIAYTVKEAHMVLCSWGLKPAYNSVTEPDFRTWDDKTKDAFDFYRKQDGEIEHEEL